MTEEEAKKKAQEVAHQVSKEYMEKVHFLEEYTKKVIDMPQDAPREAKKKADLLFDIQERCEKYRREVEEEIKKRLEAMGIHAIIQW